MAASARRIWQVEQRLPAVSALGSDRRLRCHAGDAGGDGKPSRARRHGRQYGHPSTSLCCRHKKGTQNQEALGRSRGGFSTKIHARCDEQGRPLGFTLTPGETHDTKGFPILMRMIDDRIRALIADRGYDSNAIREALHDANIEPVIPSRSNRKQPLSFNRETYKLRNRIERMFNKLKNWRRIATRYDKSASSFLAFVTVASVKQWLPFVHET
jgi:transposase